MIRDRVRGRGLRRGSLVVKPSRGRLSRSSDSGSGAASVPTTWTSSVQGGGSGQSAHLRLPGFPGKRLACAEGNPQRSELGGTRMLRCPGVDVEPEQDLEISESSAANEAGELCLRQSAGDSTRPEVDVLLCRFWNRLLYEE